MLSAQPDNSKCRYTDTRLQEERRRTLVAVDGPFLRHSAFHPSVSGSENMSVDLRHIECGGKMETVENRMEYARHYWAGRLLSSSAPPQSRQAEGVKGAARGCTD